MDNELKKYLETHGTFKNISSGDQILTTISSICSYDQDLESLAFCIRNGLNPNIKCKFGLPLISAIIDFPEGVYLLYSHGADLELKNTNNGRTPLMHSANFDVLVNAKEALISFKFLIDTGVNLNPRSNDGLTLDWILENEVVVVESISKEALDYLNQVRKERDLILEYKKMNHFKLAHKDRTEHDPKFYYLEIDLNNKIHRTGFLNEDNYARIYEVQLSNKNQFELNEYKDQFIVEPITYEEFTDFYKQI
jgi:hypothetical protein